MVRVCMRSEQGDCEKKEKESDCGKELAQEVGEGVEQVVSLEVLQVEREQEKMELVVIVK